MKDRFRSSNKADPSRWNSADPATVTKLAQNSINADLADLQDFFSFCKRNHPSLFRHWTIEQFKNWNDERIAALAEQPPIETTAQARKRMWLANGKVVWNPETSLTEVGRWNDAAGDFELIPK